MNVIQILASQSDKMALNNNLPINRIYAETEIFLSKEGVNPSEYAIGIPNCNEHYCIHLEDGFWLVYFFERGLRTSLCIFSDHHDAVNFFVWSLLSKRLPSINWPAVHSYD